MTTKAYDKIIEQIAKLHVRANVILNKEKNGVIKRIREVIQIYGITFADLGSDFKSQGSPPADRVPALNPAAITAKPDGSTVVFIVPDVVKKKRDGRRPIKYADDKGNKWSGGGSTPRWLRAEIETGKTREHFLVHHKVA